jgi:hypothetical protein
MAMATIPGLVFLGTDGMEDLPIIIISLEIGNTHRIIVDVRNKGITFEVITITRTPIIPERMINVPMIMLVPLGQARGTSPG